MANELDELTGPVNSSGNDVNVIDKQLHVKIGQGTKVFEASVWVLGLVVAFVIGLASTRNVGASLGVMLVGLIPGLIFQLKKTTALAYLRKLQQKIQADASQIDNYLEQRVIILQNLAGLITKSINLDSDVMKTIAEYRSNINPEIDKSRNDTSEAIDAMTSRINVAFEAYPDLKSQHNISEAMRQNSYLQREITAARALYNDTIATWNKEIYSWPVKQIVADKQGFTTRIPFTASSETKAAARTTFF